MTAAIRVTALWYEQATRLEVERGHVSARLTTEVGPLHMHLGSLGPETYREARRLAERLGAELVVAHDLRDAVAGWEQRDG